MEDEMIERHASYLADIFYLKSFKKKVDRIAEEIIIDIPYFKTNCIAVSGMSGCLFGGAVSYVTGLPLIAVRKEGVASHSSNPVEFPDGIRSYNYAFVDDLICKGTTLSYVMAKIKENSGWVPNAITKIYLYNCAGRVGDDKFGIIPMFCE